MTLNDTSGGREVFNDDQASGHVITNGGGNPTGPEIDIDVFSKNGVTQDVCGYSKSALLNPERRI
ncbi:MAG: hypothetical protein R3186_08190 [Ruegeria sp.]|nr:hypothetical protein [Ruegeria sp.]